MENSSIYTFSERFNVLDKHLKMAKVLIIVLTIEVLNTSMVLTIITSNFFIVMSMVLDLPLPKILLLEGIIM